MTTQRSTPTPRRIQGFTLIELMIVVAVIAILGAIAYPNYQEYARKGRRGEARAALQELMQQQERYMTQRNTYMEFNSSTSGSVPFIRTAGDSNRPRYNLRADKCKKTENRDGTGTGDEVSLRSCIKLTAEPVIADPKVDKLTITSLGAKGCTGSAKSSNFQLCWP